jgi:hypothetical protein
MVIFWPIQQELDCINNQGLVLGKIGFNGGMDQHIFSPADGSSAYQLKKKHVSMRGWQASIQENIPSRCRMMSDSKCVSENAPASFASFCLWP